MLTNRVSCIVMAALLWLTLVASAIPKARDGKEATEASTTDLSSSSTSSSSSESTCGLYLAVSSTSTIDEPKWGLYAGHDYASNQPVGVPEIAVQTFHLAGAVKNAAEDTAISTMVDYLERFFWVPISSGGQYEGGNGKIITAIPGAGAIGAYNKKLTNAEWNHSAAYFRSSIGELPGVAHPNRGAQSQYYQVQLRTKQAIPSGMEIFLNYGDSWSPDSNQEDEEEALSKDDYDKIDATIDKIMAFFEKYKDELEAQAKAEIYDFLIKDVMGAAAGAKKGRKITSMLPLTPEELAKVKAAGGSLRYSEPSAVRSVEWLDSHGRCMDQIHPGASTIPTAGRGAFATRPIPQGGLVSPIPLLQIVNDGVMNMYASASDASPSDRQLLYNYCYGHPESTMLFWPAGVAANFINHQSGEKANAKMVWSNHTFHRRHWFHSTPEELMADENLYLGLLLEIVATKDIAKDEEVFIDYGKDWQQAWDAHVQQWDNRVKSGELPKVWPLRALDLNEEYRNKPFKTEAELAKTPYPADVELRCFLVVRAPNSDEGIESTLHGKPVRVWTNAKDGTTFDGENLSPCTILERVENTPSLSYNYTVRWGDNDDVTFVKNVPHQAVIFVDKPNTSDQHTKNAFRHYISIPDDIFPQGPWRNRVAATTK